MMKLYKYNGSEFIITDCYNKQEIVGLIFNADNETKIDYSCFSILNTSTDKVIKFLVYQNLLGFYMLNPLYMGNNEIEISDIKILDDRLYKIVK